MSDQKDSPSEDGMNIEDFAEAAAQAGDEFADQTENAGSEFEAMLAELKAENAESKDRLLRATAEMQNLRKRTQREVNDARTYAIADFARDMLTATDNLERALAVLSDEARADASSDMKSLIEGIEMTEREMQRLLQKNGVKPIMAEGEKFNPHKHQAMFEVPNDQVPEGTVVNVMQQGFEIGDRVLRPAMVGVSKGGAKTAKPAPLETDVAEPNISDSAAAEDIEQSVHIDKEV